jgi:hypothetical protein
VFQYQPRVEGIGCSAHWAWHAHGPGGGDLFQARRFGLERRKAWGGVELDEELAPAALQLEALVDTAAADRVGAFDDEWHAGGVLDGFSNRGPGVVYSHRTGPISSPWIPDRALG